VGDDGPTHHGVFDLVFLRCVPNLIIACPRDANSLRNMLHTALTLDRPFIIRYPRGVVDRPPRWDEDPVILEVGKAEVLREGDEGVAFCLGPTYHFALRLSRFKVVDLAFAKPLDVETIVESSLRFDRVYVFEEGSKIGGVGEEIGALLLSHGIKPREFKVFAIPDRFIEHGDRGELLEEIFGIEKGKDR